VSVIPKPESILQHDGGKTRKQMTPNCGRLRFGTGAIDQKVGFG
jgi:hypothetical protein